MKRIKHICCAIFLLITCFILSSQANASTEALTVVNFTSKVISVQATSGIFKGECGDKIKPNSYTPAGTPESPAIKKISWNDVRLICGAASGNCTVYACMDDNPEQHCAGLRAAEVGMDLSTGKITIQPLQKKYLLDGSTPYKLVFKEATD